MCVRFRADEAILISRRACCYRTPAHPQSDLSKTSQTHRTWVNLYISNKHFALSARNWTNPSSANRLQRAVGLSGEAGHFAWGSGIVLSFDLWPFTIWILDTYLQAAFLISHSFWLIFSCTQTENIYSNKILVPRDWGEESKSTSFGLSLIVIRIFWPVTMTALEHFCQLSFSLQTLKNHRLLSESEDLK